MKWFVHKHVTSTMANLELELFYQPKLLLEWMHDSLVQYGRNYRLREDPHRPISNVLDILRKKNNFGRP